MFFLRKEEKWFISEGDLISLKANSKIETMQEYVMNFSLKPFFQIIPTCWNISLTFLNIMLVSSTLCMEKLAEKPESLFRLHDAVLASDTNEIKKLIEEGINIEFRDAQGQTPLHLAAATGNLAMVKYLVGLGAPLEALDFNGCTPLIRAQSSDVVNFLKEKGAHPQVFIKPGLLEKLKTLRDHMQKWHLSNYGSASLLHLAAKVGELETLKFLLARGDNKDVQDRDGENPLHFAARENHLEVVIALLDHGVDKESVTKHGYRPLHFAAQKGSLPIVKLLLARGALINAQSVHGITPLCSASRWGKGEVMRYLLENGADITLGNPLHVAAEGGEEEATSCLLAKGAAIEALDKDGHRPIHVASRSRNRYLGASHTHPKVVKVLLAAGANIEAPVVEEEGWRALHFAAYVGNVEGAQVLLDHGANKDAIAADGYTPLMTAISEGQTEVVQLLLERGAAVDVRTRDERFPLFLAARNGHAEIVKLLLKHKACNDFKDGVKYCPLHYAAFFGRIAALQVLLKHGSNIEVGDIKGLRALHLAARRGTAENVEAVKLLLRAGANKEAKTLVHLSKYSNVTALGIAQMLLNESTEKNAEHFRAMIELLKL